MVNRNTNLKKPQDQYIENPLLDSVKTWQGTANPDEQKTICVRSPQPMRRHHHHNPGRWRPTPHNVQSGPPPSPPGINWLASPHQVLNMKRLKVL